VFERERRACVVRSETEMSGIYSILAIHAGLVVVCLRVAAWFMARRMWMRASIAVAVLPLLMFGWYEASGQSSVAAVLYPSDTRYRNKYVDSGFKAIGVGDTEASVKARIGQPLSTRMLENQRWMYYSQHGRRKSYWNKVIIIDINTSRVVRIVDEFYAA
jgi:outer membrane protein assembly factor BamE (lipoprotein component of BamABCDE complex)